MHLSKNSSQATKANPKYIYTSSSFNGILDLKYIYKMEGSTQFTFFLKTAIVKSIGVVAIIEKAAYA